MVTQVLIVKAHSYDPEVVLEGRADRQKVRKRAIVGLVFAGRHHGLATVIDRPVRVIDRAKEVGRSFLLQRHARIRHVTYSVRQNAAGTARPGEKVRGEGLDIEIDDRVGQPGNRGKI